MAAHTKVIRERKGMRVLEEGRGEGTWKGKGCQGEGEERREVWGGKVIRMRGKGRREEK